MRVILSVTLSILCSTLIAQTSTIIGSAHQDYVGKPAYLYITNDAISGLKVLADSTTVGADGMLKFKTSQSKIVQATISIDRVNGTFFLGNGNNYEIYFPQLPTDQAKTFNGSNRVELVFNKLATKDINNLISQFNREFDNFFDANVADAFDKDFKLKVAAFRAYCDSLFKPEGVRFFDDYRHFAFANFESSLGYSRKYMGDKYLEKVQVDVANPEFANFVSNFYGNYIDRFELYSNKRPLTEAIKKAAVTEFVDQLRNDDGLKDQPELREVVALTNLYQAYSKKGALKTNIIKMLGEFQKIASTAQTRAMSQDILKQLTRFDVGSPAYNFRLTDTDGDIVRLDAFKGKTTLLVFAAGWSRESLSQLKLVNDLYNKYNKNVNFVLVDLDDKEEDMGYLLSATGTLIKNRLNYSSDKYIVEAMNVLYLPQFILIDKNGNYLNWNAPEPDHGLVNLLEANLN